MDETISAYTDAETARRVRELADQEQRKQAQIAGAALKLYVQLSPEAREAWRAIEQQGAPALALMQQEVTRALLHVQYTWAQQQAAEAMGQPTVPLASEDELLAEAVRLTG
jgi:predicted transcriptional regulator